MDTRWSSQFRDPQSIYVDLGAVQHIDRVVLKWEAAYGRDFKIQTSNDAATWTTAKTVTGNTSKTDDMSVSLDGRYVRMYGTKRATQWGYSLYEFEVYGTAVVVPPPVTPPPTPGVTPPALPGTWSLSFADEFGANSIGTTWKDDLWGMKSGGPASVANGLLSLSATKGVEGTLSTNQSYSFKYGYAEARIKIPAGQGIWPAFWMLPMPADGSNDDAGEIDIMEIMGDEPSVMTTAYHVNQFDAGEDTDTGVNLSAGFHTYAVDWQPDHITFYLDGKQVDTVTSAQAPIVADPSYLILDVWLGGWHGQPDASTNYPATMQVDWVRVWNKA